MVYDLAEDLFARLQRRSLLFDSGRRWATMSRITGDSWSVYQVPTTLLFTPGHALLTIVLMVVLKWGSWTERSRCWRWRLAPFMVIASLLIGKPLHAAAKLKRESRAHPGAHSADADWGFRWCRRLPRRTASMRGFRPFADAAIRAQQRSTLLGSLNSLSSA